jgi:hypothetical protein
MSASNTGLGFTVPGVVAVLAVVGVLWFDGAPLQTLRPPNSGLADQSFSDQKVPARLWQDPFEAVERFLKPPEPRPDPTTAPPPAPAPTAAPAPDEPTQVLAVLVNAEPYAESVEGRLRSRHAILSALEMSRYLPVDSTHVGYFQPHGDGLPKVVPYERFERLKAGEAPDRLMLLWLASDAFKQEPLSRIRAVVEQAAAGMDPRMRIVAPVKVLGPASSDGLVGYLKDIYTFKKTAADPPLELEFFSAIATATDESLKRAVGLDSERRGDCKDSAYDCPALRVSLRRFIPTDDHLAVRLNLELRDRGLYSQSNPSPPLGWPRQINEWVKGILGNPALILEWPRQITQWVNGIVGGWFGAAGPADIHEPKRVKRVVLISEWDTIYGRSLPLAVQKHLVPLAGHDEGQPRVDLFTYMRGLDGNIPSSQGKQEAPRAAPGAASGALSPPPRVTPANERAEGQAQLDYLRRLADELAEGPNRVFAIGILGSDLHDKMLILQALRPKFPAAVFFTTDLDARMFDSAYEQATRGLIVASGFDLRPAECDPSASFPPFRTNYQTAIFHAVRQAFPRGTASDETRAARCQVIDKPAAVVRLYEIGRHGPIALVNPAAPVDPAVPRTESSRNGPTELVNPAAVPSPPDPTTRGLAPGKSADWLLAFFYFTLTLAGVYLLYDPAIRRFLRTHPLGALGLLVLVILLALGLWYAFSHSVLVYPLRPPGVPTEPFSLASGTSGWIPIYLTTLAVALSVLFVPLMFMERARALGEIERRYITNAAADSRPRSVSAQSYREGFARDWAWLRCRGASLAGRLKRVRGGLDETTGPGEQAGSGAVATPGAGASDDGPALPAEGSRESDQAQALWQRHRRRVRLDLRLLGPLSLALLFFFFVMSLFPAIGGNSGTGALRGEDLRQFMINLRPLSIFGVSVLVFLYLDLAFCARHLIAELSPKTVSWPEPVRRRYADEELRVDISLVDRWISLRVVARYADMAVRAAVYPLLVLLLLVAARLPWFDTTVLSPAILIAFVVLAFYLLLSAWIVQRAARRLRAATLGDYRDQLRDAAARPGGLPPRRQLENLIERVETMHDFAFQRFSENPLIKLAILPFGTLGFGLLELLG